MDTDDRVDPAPMSRRGLLVGTTALGLLAAGCGAGTGPPAPATGGPPATAAAPGFGAAGTVLGPTTAVPVGGGTVFETLEVVVTQRTAGDFRGFSAECTHTGCIVNQVTNGEIECPCHGSRYHLDGSVANGPAPRPLSARPVRVDAGQIVLT
jgi:Rieske Fe-S protein